MRWLTAATLVALLACGGKAVIDGEPGSGGAGGNGGTAANTTSLMAVGAGPSVVSTSTGAGGSVNGCTLEAAEDHTSGGQVVITWSNPSQRCLLVVPGTGIVWEGNFMLHPLAGGVTPTVDAGSPITQADQSGSSVTVQVFDTGVYPYFCQVHTATMQGVIYVK
jgi:plastocyanin